MKKWKIVIITCLMVFANSIHATDTIEHKKSDQLVKELNQLAPNDTARFQIYLSLISMASSIDIETYYTNKMTKEAEAQNNDNFKCQAYFQQIILAYNQFDSEGVTKWVQKLEPIARKTKNYYFLFYGRRAAIDMLVINGEYEKEEKEAKKMLLEAQKINYPTGMALAYICLSTAYGTTYRKKEACEVLIKAHSIALADKDRSLVYQINNYIINTYQEMGDNKNYLKWIKIADNYLQEQIREGKETEEDVKGWLMLTNISYVNYYTNIKDPQHAAIYLKRAEKYRMDEYGTYGKIYHIARFHYFRSTNQLNEALAETDALADIFKEISPDSYAYTIFMKASTLAELKKENEAVSVYKRAFQISDSIEIVFLNRQTEQLKKDYDTDSLILEREKINKKLRTSFLGVIVLVILFLIIFTIHTLRMRCSLKKSEEEMRKMAKEMEIANIAKENFLSTISSSISVPLNEVVKGSLLLANEEVTDKQEQQSISRKLNKVSAELMGLINNILNLSKLEAGMMKFRMSNIELLPFAQEAVKMSVSTGNTVQSSYNEAAKNLKVQVDEGHMIEVFKHLLQSDNKIILIIKAIENNRYIHIQVIGSELSTLKQSQDIAISNEVNRLLIESFGGKYKVNAEESSICFTLPVIS